MWVRRTPKSGGPDLAPFAGTTIMDCVLTDDLVSFPPLHQMSVVEQVAGEVEDGSDISRFTNPWILYWRSLPLPTILPL